ncbi:MAG: PQQ-binding-like beta-propeller repeat protein [Candidatus Bathyarchaeia archaeon]
MGRKEPLRRIVRTTIMSLLLISSMLLLTTNFEATAAATVDRATLLQYENPGQLGNTNTHFTEGPAPNSANVLWKKELTPAMGNNPIAHNGMIIITQGSRVVAMDGFTGDTVWNVSAPNVASGRGSITAAYMFALDNTRMVYVASVASKVNATHALPAIWEFVCISLSDGSLLWRSDQKIGPMPAYKGLYVKEEKMYYCGAGYTDGRGGTQNAGSTQAWDFSDPTKQPTLKWTYVGEWCPQEVGYITYGDGKLFMCDAGPHQTCIDAKTGQVLWVTQLTGAPAYTGVYYNGVIYKGCLDNVFVAMEGNTGKILWTNKPSAFGFWCSGAAAAYGMIYMDNVDGNVYALDAKTGRTVWQHWAGGMYYPGYIQVADGKVYTTLSELPPSPLTPETSHEEYGCLDAYTGEVIWSTSHQFEQSASTYCVIAYGNLYGRDKATGAIYCFSTSTKPAKDWTMFGGDPAHTATGDAGPTNPGQKWVFHTDGGVISSPAVVAGKVYIGSYDKNWYCLDASTGTKIWSFTTGYYIRSSPAVVGGKMYSGADDGFVYCLDANTGSQLWKTPAPGQILPIMTGTYPEWRSSPTVADGKVYVGSLDGKLYRIDANTGGVDWTIQTTRAIISTPAYVAGDGLYFASTDGFVYKVNPTTGSVIWNASTPIGLEIAMEGSPCVGNGKVVIGSGAAKNSPAGLGQIYCFNAATGERLWTYSQQKYNTTTPNLQPIWTPLYINHATLGPMFVFGDFYHMTGVNATDGKPFWTTYLTREHFGLPSYADGKIYVPADTFGIYVLDATSGLKVGYFEAGSQVRSSPAVYDGKVYFGCLNWNVYCVGESSSGTIYYGPAASPEPTQTPAQPTTQSPEPTPLPSTEKGPGSGISTETYIVIAAAVIVVVVAMSAVMIFRRKQK